MCIRDRGFLARQDASGALGERREFVLAGVDANGRDPADAVDDRLGEDRRMGRAAGDQDRVDASGQHRRVRADRLGDLVGHGVQHLGGGLVAVSYTHLDVYKRQGGRR